MVQTTVLVSILMICVGAAVFLHHRPRWTRITTGAPDDLGGVPVPAVAPAPGPPPPPAAAPPMARAEPAPAPAPRPAEIIETPAERPAPVSAGPAARRARNNGFDRFAAPAARARAHRA
ncbi:hypothetical protein [Actinoplanes sp. NPDC026623]|uniref:hypothetical protein n=1 Tax=Actinoplanes sp. NPDC026623 TaxID=3155610 RepID=UPI0033FDE828